MASRLKQYLLLAAAGAALYFLLTHHIVFHGEDANFVKNIYFLKKSKLDLNETFVSLNQKSPDAIMKVKVLRENGIGELMVEIGMITDEERRRLESRYR
ncbi:MAG: hypothetical protein MUF46_03810 [Desulfobacterales bacterium]|jgi:hypothetical protein|nr:hypothetical protein [Desulfobacterales bacterium]